MPDKHLLRPLDGSSSIPVWHWRTETRRFSNLFPPVCDYTRRVLFPPRYSDTTTPIELQPTNISVYLSSVDHMRNDRNNAAGLGHWVFQLFNKTTGVLLTLGSGATTKRGFMSDLVSHRISLSKGGSLVFALSTTGKTGFQHVTMRVKKRGKLLILKV